MAFDYRRFANSRQHFSQLAVDLGKIGHARIYSPTGDNFSMMGSHARAKYWKSLIFPFHKNTPVHQASYKLFTMSNETPQRRVSFSPSVRCVATTSLYDYTPQEIAASWFDAKEMEAITTRCFKLITKMDAGLADKYCTRGLEGHSTVGRTSKKKNRVSSIAAVLMEQSNQWVDNKVDELAIADAYRRTTSSCQMWARVMAKRDQEAAEAILFEDDDDTPCLTDEANNRSSVSSITSKIRSPKQTKRRVHDVCTPTRLARAA